VNNYNAIYEKILEKYNKRQFVFSKGELISELVKTPRNSKHKMIPISDIKKVLILLQKAHLIRIRAANADMYEFRCDYTQLRQYMIDLTKAPSTLSNDIELELVTKDELINARFELDMKATDNFDKMLKELEDDDDDDDDFLSSLFDDDDDDEKTSTGSTLEQYNKVKEMLSDYLKTNPSRKESEFHWFLNGTYPSDSPIKIGFLCDDKAKTMYFTDSQETYRYLLNNTDGGSKDLVHLLLEKIEDTSPLVFIDNALCAPLEYQNIEDYDDLDCALLIFAKRIREFLSQHASWLINTGKTSNDDLEAKISAFLVKTMPNSYTYQDEEMFEKVVISFIERIMSIDYKISQDRAVQVAKTLEAYWKRNHAQPSTLKIINRVKQELESCSTSDFYTLKIQLFAKQ